MGYDQFTGRNYDYRKDWIEHRIEYLAQYFSIDVLAYSILSNHMHLVLRQRPDIVKTWDDTEVARRWLLLCPKKKNKDGTPKEPTEPQLNSIRNNASKVKQITDYCVSPLLFPSSLEKRPAMTSFGVSPIAAAR